MALSRGNAGEVDDLRILDPLAMVRTCRVPNGGVIRSVGGVIRSVLKSFGQVTRTVRLCHVRARMV